MGILSFAGRWTKEAVLDVNGWEDILCGVDIGTEWNLKQDIAELTKGRL